MNAIAPPLPSDIPSVASIAPLAPSAPAAPSRRLVLAAGISFSVIWSSAFVAGRIGLDHAAPLTLLAIRFLVAGLLFGATALLLGRSIRLPARAGRTLAAGLLCNAVYLGLAYWGLQGVPTALTAVLVSACPLLTLLLAAGLEGEKLTPTRLVGILLGMGGVLWITRHRLTVEHLQPIYLLAIAAGTVALALGTVLSKKVAAGQDLLSAVTLQFIASGLVLLPLAFFLEDFRCDGSAALWGSLAYSVVVSLASTLLMLWLLRHGQASSASSFHFLNPFFGTLFAVTLLGERMFAGDLLGVLPIAMGIALVAWQK